MRLHENLEQPAIQNIVISKLKGDDENFTRIEDAQSAAESDFLEFEKGAPNTEWFTTGPPCITLNIPGSRIDAKEMWTWSNVAIMLQILMLAFPAVATHYFKWLRKGEPVPQFAFGIFAIGVVFNVGGLMLCGHVIEASSEEAVLSWNKGGYDYVAAVIQLQLASTVGSQRFPSCAMMLVGGSSRLWISRPSERKRRLVSL